MLLDTAEGEQCGDGEEGEEADSQKSRESAEDIAAERGCGGSTLAVLGAAGVALIMFHKISGV